MKRQLIPLLLFAAAAVAAPPLKDFAGLKDPELFTRLPNYYLQYANAVIEKQFDQFKFWVNVGSKREQRAVEGHYFHYIYTFDRASGAPASPLQIMRNYQAAAARLGGKVLFEDGVHTTIMIARAGKEIWVDLAPVNGGNNYHLQIVEREAMKQDVLANAQVFDAGLKQTGHVEVPGILFDFGKADVKPESDAALKEVVKLMQANPALKVWVVGHTDSVGSAESNLTLSGARAASVVKALAAMGVDARRLASHGAGPFAPVASNTTEEGRAKNRRVELVQQ